MKNAAAVALGRIGGLKGGKARAESLSPERRKEIAIHAANKRWGNDRNIFYKKLCLEEQELIKTLEAISFLKLKYQHKKPG